MKVKLIGGLLDGETPDIEERAYACGYVVIRVAILPPQLSLATAKLDTPVNVTIGTAAYARRTICDIEVWAAERLRPPQIIELLVQRYAK